MNTSGLKAGDGQNAKELDSMKESISDIINQLQDIDPARLSFSPFLDLDTQICMAPVSDSPESSVEELHSSSHSASGSQRSLEHLPSADEPKNSASSHQQPSNGLHEEKRRHGHTEEGALDQTLSTPITAERNLAGATENCIKAPTLMSQGDIPNGTNTPKWSPESPCLSCTGDEDRPLMAPPPDSVELTVWSPEGVLDTREESGRCCCVCKCCQSGRVPAFLSVLASLLCASAILYALHSYVHVQLPDCPDVTSRVVFTLCCCAVATVPVVLAMLLGAMCRFCSASFSLHDSPPRRHAIQQLFVTASLQLLFLYVLNLLVMAAFIPQQQLKLVPMLVAMFILGRLVYWASLNACSSWRGFGSGLTIFPLMALLVYNLFLLYNLYRCRESLLPSQDIFFNQVTTSSWLGETTQSPSGTPDVLATNFPNSQ